MRALKFPRHVVLPLAALPIIIASATLSYRSLELFHGQTHRLEQTRIVLRQAANLREAVRRLESSQKGYLLTGKSIYFAEYNRSVQAIQTASPEFLRVTRERPDVSNQAGAIVAVIHDKLAVLSRTVKLYRSGDRAGAIALMERDENDDNMRPAIDRLDELRSSGQKEFSDSLSQGALRARDSFIMSTGGDVVLLLFLTAAGGLINREDQRRASDEEAIRVLNSRLERELKQRTDILESIQDGFCAFDARGGLTYVNPAASRMLGIEPNRVEGHTASEFFGKEFETALPGKTDEVEREAEVRTAERYFPERGKRFLLRLYPAAERGMTVYVTDVTEERNAEAERARLLTEVQEARALLNALFENAPVGFGFWDCELRFVRVNRALAEMNHLPANQHTGRTLPEVIPDLDSGVTEAFERVLKTGKPVLGQEVHVPNPAQPGQGRSWLVSYFPVWIKGEIIGAGAVWEDVTKRRAAERGMQQAAKLESLGVLAGGIAHDFNNLLTGILGNASLVLDLTPAGQPTRPLLSDVIVASQRAADLTRQLLAYAGKGRFDMRTISLAEVVKEVQGLVRLSVPRRVRLTLELADPLPPVVADVSQFQSVIMNLVINAAEAIPEGAAGEVTMRLSAMREGDSAVSRFRPQPAKADGYVLLEVIDTGVGMDEGTMARIFDPFFTTKFTGRGLGLAAALGVIQAHNAGLRVESAPGKGTQFQVLFPASAEKRAPAPAPDEEREVRGNATILVVDDEDTVRRATKASLERHGYQVVLAEDGREGVELLRVLRDKISLVLLDLTMPEMSGDSALREMRMIRPDIKVVLSSGFSEMEAVERFSGRDLTDFLQKPYTARKLAATVAKALSS